MAVTTPATPIAALREIERRLLPSQTSAATAEAWDAYAKEWLPNYKFGAYSDIERGFDAGYRVAMALVRRELAAVQTQALRSEK